jgi:hypothetical protein
MTSRGRVTGASSLVALSVALTAAVVSGSAFASGITDEMRPASRENYDALAARAARRNLLARPSVDPALVRADAPIHLHEILGVPTFLWAARGGVPGGAGRQAYAAPSPLGPEGAARSILSRYASAYGLDGVGAAGAVLRELHATGRGGLIARFGQETQGIEVFRNEIKVLMTRDLAPVALAGYLTAHVPTGVFVLTPQEAIAAAARDYTGAPVDAGVFRETGRRQDAYVFFDATARTPLAAGARLAEPTRVKPVWFDLPEGLVPAYYLELEVAGGDTRSNDMFSYVVSAVDGSILFRNNLTADASFGYRVWAETSGAHRPFDGPQGTDTSPHVALDGFEPSSYPAPNLVTLSSGPISAGDPWLPAGATETIGNNVEAYVDLFSPDGFSAGDFHATVTAPGVFDYTHDLTLAPNYVPPSGSRSQQMAVITQLFYNLNFFHDWYYDSGFNEAAGNAQTSNYGRGGIEGDSIKAEAQDFGGRNNANMSTPADGGRPRMQMYLFDGLGDKKITVTTTPDSLNLPLGDYAPVGTAAFGPTAFATSAEIVWAGAGGNHDGCGNANVNGAAGIGVPATGKIVFIDRGGSCTGGFAQKYQNAVLAGASGVIIGNISTSSSPGTAPGMAGTPTGATTIGILSLNYSMAQQFRAGFTAGTVLGTLSRPVPGVDRDGSLDNQIQAHEWGHYISNRLVGNANGLTANLSRGLGEGWADFHALLLTVRAEDVSVTGNDQWQAPYALGAYATPAFSAPANPYYFGIRRFPFSTDLTKDPLMYRHIANGNTITGAPINLVIDDGSGSNNAEVHNTGEIWATMLWECYASLLRDVTNNTSGRGLTFAQAQQKMKDILVAAYKMTPNDPTLLEARDAVLAAAFADDATDYALFAAAFAKRGAGALAVSPNRYTPSNVGVVEDTTPPIGLALAATPAVGDDVTAVCTADGILQIGDTGTMTIVLKNLVAGTAPATSGTLASTTTGVVVNTPGLSFPAAPSRGTTSASTTISLTGAASGTKFDFTLTLTNALGAAPVVIPFSIRANYNVGTSATDDVESPHSVWIATGSPAWSRIESGPAAHRWLGPDAGTFTDITLTSPVLQVGGGTFSFTFQHRWQFEFSTTGPTFFDGGVVEISTDNGATWADVGSTNISTLGLGGYLASVASGSSSVSVNPILASGGLNNLQTRPAFAGISPLYPSMLTTTVNLGSAFANKAVRVRFRIGTDVGGPGVGWEIDNIAFSGVVNQPFDALVASTGACPSTATPPTALAGPNQSVLQNAAVTLDGTSSTTPNGGTLTYTWVQIGGPSVSLNTPTSAKPTFTAPAVAPTSTTASASVTLIFMLTVNDGTATSAPSYVTVTVTNPNRIPVANAGTAQTVTAGALVTLNGSATDADAGTVFTWAWTQTGGPTVTLSSTTAQKPTFTAPNVAATTVYTFQLVVNDGQVNSAATTTTVTVNPAPCVVNSVVIVAPAAVCAGSTGNIASVPAAGGPPYAWQILSGGTITSAADGPSITFTAGSSGPVVIGVSVGSAACIFTNQVSVPVTALPSTTITAPASVVSNSTGNTASVPDAGSGATYVWGISGGTITFSGTFSNTVTFTAGASGSVVLSVTVTQNGCSASGTSASIPITPSTVGRLALLATPCRALDTRNPNGSLAGPALVANATRVFPVSTSSCGIPPTAAAIAVNYAVTGPTAAGSLTADGGNLQPPPTTVLSFRAGQTRANNGILRLATDGSGTIAVTNGSPGTVHLILDVVGYFQ